MTSPGRTWRGVSADDRRAERRARLLEACLEVVGRAGVLATTADAICAEAAIHKRYFYVEFADRDAALAAALADLLGDIEAQVRSVAARHNDARVRTRRVVTAFVDALLSDPRRGRLYAEAQAVTAMRDLRDAAVTRFTELIASSVLEFGDQPRKGISRNAAVRLVVGGTTDLVTAWLAGTYPVSRRSLVDTIVAVGLAVSTEL